MENFKELYKELATKVHNDVPEIRWIDLWNSQVYNLEGEHPFPTPAVFFAFRSQNMEDLASKIQKVQMQVDVFLFYETFLDTFKGAYNQDEALAFLDNIDLINKALQGSSGTHYTNMKRVSFSPVDTGGSGNLYTITYTCECMDYSAVDNYEDGTFADLTIIPNSPEGYVIDQTT